jgi:nicotinate-nucleotide adenylyltransferase
MMTKVGIYPGAFDPVHDGHLAFARAAMAQHGLDRVFFLPEPSPRHKQGVKALEHRVQMVQLATKNDAKLGVIVLEQSRFTVHETWPLITARFKTSRLYMLLGSDVAQRLAAWPDIEEFIESVPSFLIALRKKDNPKDVIDKLKVLSHTKGSTFDYFLMDAPERMVSSAQIRAQLRRGKQPADISEAVLKYIARNGLYASAGSEK